MSRRERAQEPPTERDKKEHLQENLFPKTIGPSKFVSPFGQPTSALKSRREPRLSPRKSYTSGQYHGADTGKGQKPPSQQNIPAQVRTENKRQKKKINGITREAKHDQRNKLKSYIPTAKKRRKKEEKNACTRTATWGTSGRRGRATGIETSSPIVQSLAAAFLAQGLRQVRCSDSEREAST